MQCDTLGKRFFLSALRGGVNYPSPSGHSRTSPIVLRDVLDYIYTLLEPLGQRDFQFTPPLRTFKDVLECPKGGVIYPPLRALRAKRGKAKLGAQGALSQWHLRAFKGIPDCPTMNNGAP